MEEFVTEHGGLIISGIVSVCMTAIIILIIYAVSNMDVFSLDTII